MNHSQQLSSRLSAVDSTSDGLALAREELDHELLGDNRPDNPDPSIQRFLTEFDPATLADKLLESLNAAFVLFVGLDEKFRISYVIDHAIDKDSITDDESRLLPKILNEKVDASYYDINSPHFGKELRNSCIAATEFAARTIFEGDRAFAAIYVGFAAPPAEARRSLTESLLAFSSHFVAMRLRLQHETELRRTTEDHLRRAQRLSNVGKLASGIAHDFNNLLTVIQGHAALLELSAEKDIDEKSKESLELIISASQQAVDLTKQLLLFGRNNQTTKLETCNLNSVVEDFVKMIRRMIEESIEIKVDVDETTGSIKADKSMIGQILMNLIVNSRDAMPDGGEIEVSTTSVKIDSDDDRPVPAGNYVCLSVKDTGGGMTPRQLEKIFDPFFSTKGKGKGTGLGLANVAAIVKDHGGHIDVASQKGVGTTFEILIPTIGSVPDAPKKVSQDVSRNSLDGCNILLVEDESSVRKLVRKLLEMLGCQVVEAVSGKQALDLWSEIGDKVAVVVSDIVMPEGVSGWELAKELHDRDPSLGILLTSGYNERPEDHGLGDEPSVAFLQKPYDSGNLKKTLARLLEHREKSA